MKRFKYLTMAALVALWACDSGSSTPTETAPVTGTIAGTVTIEGTGASGVTVTLSSGTTTTTGSDGTYTFSSVPAGAYTVSISGYASDATFDATAKAATITTAGQVATVNFAGSYIKTSSIVGVVTGGGSPLTGVTVSMGSSSTTTDASGAYSFSGLRKGSYTVSISGYDATMYTFSSTSTTVDLGVGESKVVSFNGSLVTTASITGRMFLDENNKDNTYTAGLEDNLAVAGVTVTLEGGAVNNTTTTQTASDGTYSFSNLAAGTYRVTLDATSSALPGNVAFGGTSNTEIVTVTAGATGTVNWPFDITMQTVKTYGYLGIDGTDPGVSPIKGWPIDLYDTEANAAKGLAAGKINTATVKTDANGEADFRFSRSADTDPNGGASDGIVFARVAGTGPGGSPGALYTVNGEHVIEIKFNPKDSVTTAVDTFDALYTQVVVGFVGREIDQDPLNGWIGNLIQNKDTTAAWMNGTTSSKGYVYWTLTGFNRGAPDTLWARVRAVQTKNNGHAWSQTPSGFRGTAMGSYLRFIWDGTIAPGDTITLGSENIKYMDTDIVARMFHEADDSTGAAAYTGGDDFTGVSRFDGELYTKASGTYKSKVAAAAFSRPLGGAMTFLNQPVDSTYQVRARLNGTSAALVSDSVATVTLTGADQVDTVDVLHGNAGPGTFAMKFNDNRIGGIILAADGTPAAGVWVNVMAEAGNVGSTTDTTIATNGAGRYSTTRNLLDGAYTVTAADSTTADGTVWSYNTTLKTPTSGSADNTDARTGSRTVMGVTDAKTVNFQAVRMDTKIEGVVVNDRDSDYNTIDPEEALSGVTINLYRDNSGAVTKMDTLVATTTTDANGAYKFTWLPEGHYIVGVTQPSNATVLRALDGVGSVTDTVVVHTAAADGTGASATYNQDNTRQVGNMDPPAQGDELPRWNYLTGTAAADAGNLLIAGKSPNATNGALTTAPTNFVHLFTTGTVTGYVKSGGTGVAGVTVTLTRCWTTGAQPSPPAAFAVGTCAKEGAPTPNFYNQSTDANGKYTFTGLLEGVYLIDVAPATAGYTTITTPVAGTSYLATLNGNNDVETAPDVIIS
jgi:hypothetical protein